jgi:hypothetical protein
MQAYYEHKYKVWKKYLLSQKLQNISRGEDFRLYVTDKFNNNCSRYVNKNVCKKYNKTPEGNNNTLQYLCNSEH